MREHAAAVLADLMKGVDEDQARHFLDRAYNEANALHKKRRKMLVFVLLSSFSCQLLNVPSKQAESAVWTKCL